MPATPYRSLLIRAGNKRSTEFHSPYRKPQVPSAADKHEAQSKINVNRFSVIARDILSRLSSILVDFQVDNLSVFHLPAKLLA